MALYQTDTTNPLKVSKIPKSEIALSIHSTADGIIDSFTIQPPQFAPLNLDKNGRISLCAYNKTEEQRISLGTVGAAVGAANKIFAISTRGPVYFRVIVTEPSSPKLLASCEGISLSSLREESGEIPLLPVDIVDTLGERFWEIVLIGDAHPVLNLNSNIELNMLAKLRGDPLTRGLIIPQAVEQILLHYHRNPSEDEGSWQTSWTTFLQDRDMAAPEEEAEEDEISEWARSSAQRFSNENKFLTSFLHSNTGDSDD